MKILGNTKLTIPLFIVGLFVTSYVQQSCGSKSESGQELQIDTTIQANIIVIDYEQGTVFAVNN